MKFPAESVCPPTEEARASSQFEFRIPTPRHGALNNPVGKGNIPPPLNLNVEKKLSEYNTEIVGQEVKTPIIKPTALTSSSMSSTPILGFQNLSTSAGSNNSNLSTPVDDTMIFSSPDGSIATKIPGKFSDGLIRTPANSGFSPFVLSTPSYPVSYQIIDRPDLGFLRSPETPFAVRAEFNRQIPSLSHLMGTTIGKGYVHQLQMNQDLNEKNSCSTPPVGYMVPPSLTNSPGTFPKIPQALRIPHMIPLTSNYLSAQTSERPVDDRNQTRKQVEPLDVMYDGPRTAPSKIPTDDDYAALSDDTSDVIIHLNNSSPSIGDRKGHDLDTKPEGSQKKRRIQGSGKAGSSCHQCKSRQEISMLTYCMNQKKNLPENSNRPCRKKYCDGCLQKFYHQSPPTHRHTDNTDWACPACQGICTCAACKKIKLDKESGCTTSQEVSEMISD